MNIDVLLLKVNASADWGSLRGITVVMSLYYEGSQGPVVSAH